MTKLILFTVLLLGSAGTRADQLATHGMLLFGNQKTYASHLPMFHAPHNYQLVMELSLKNLGNGQVVEKYNALKTNAADIFTLVPEPMDLTQVIDGGLKSFKAEIFQGHFEKGGKSLGDVLVVVNKVITSSKLSESPSDDNYYLLFGESGEYFAAHLISGKPDFDQILTIDHPYMMDQPPCHGRRFCSGPPKTVLMPDQDLPFTAQPLVFGPKKPIEVNETLGVLSDVMALVKKVNYLETAELAH